MSLPAIKNDQIYTYGDYARWPEGERWELIDGVAYNMSPAPNREHQEITGEIFLAIGNYLKNRPCRVFIAPFDVRLPEGDEEDKFIKDTIQPDISVVCDETKLDKKGLRGAPDLAIEVLSPSTAKKDMTVKKDLLERHGTREYWLFHPTDSLVYAFTLKTDESTGKASYGVPVILGYEDILKSSVLEGFELDLSTVLKEIILPEDPPGMTRH